MSLGSLLSADPCCGVCYPKRIVETMASSTPQAWGVVQKKGDYFPMECGGQGIDKGVGPWGACLQFGLIKTDALPCIVT